MRVVYVAKHDSGGNDDEGAIHFALEKLGHDVVRVREAHSKKTERIEADFLLCHHWHDYATLAKVTIPKVCWCFDLIDWPTPAGRHAERREWARRMADLCDVCFFTDGDWAARNGGQWLTQGADERESAEWSLGTNGVDVLFVGGIGYGRDKFVQEMRMMYGGYRFKHIAKGCHGAALQHEIASAKIIVAPPTPISARYWSNRVYNMLRMGGFMLHPHIAELKSQLPCLPTYTTMDDLHGMIDYYRGKPEQRKQIAELGHRYVMQHHTYRHRVEAIVDAVKGLR